MKFSDRRKSDNIQNRGRGGGRGPMIGGGGLIVALLIFLLTGDPLSALQGGLALPSNQTQQVNVQEEMTAEEQELYDYSAVVLADTEDAWNYILGKEGIPYREPTLNVYKGTIQTGCGTGQSGMGPFYCSVDEQIYMDLDFYRTLVRDFGAKDDDFILSYVISHEVAHHVQKVTGVLGKVDEARARASKKEANELTVRLELQADYLAGVVARYQEEKGYLDPGDIDGAISAAWSIGDDTIQETRQGYVVPESFTHGTSDQRTRWYKLGYETGDLSKWNTFTSTPASQL